MTTIPKTGLYYIGYLGKTKNYILKNKGNYYTKDLKHIGEDNELFKKILEERTAIFNGGKLRVATQDEEYKGIDLVFERQTSDGKQVRSLIDVKVTSSLCYATIYAREILHGKLGNRNYIFLHKYYENGNIYLQDKILLISQTFLKKIFENEIVKDFVKGINKFRMVPAEEGWYLLFKYILDTTDILYNNYNNYIDFDELYEEIYGAGGLTTEQKEYIEFIKNFDGVHFDVSGVVIDIHYTKQKNQRRFSKDNYIVKDYENWKISIKIEEEKVYKLC